MGFDKMFAELNNKPILLYSLKAFQAAELIDEIIVVGNNTEKISALCKEHGITKLIAIVSGGEDRSASVRNGVNAITRESGLVAVHDGARPLITAELINKVIETAIQHKAAIPVIPVKDTIKTVADGFITATPDRNTMFSAQTPQAFDLQLYRRTTLTSATDDSALIEQLGVKVKTVQGDIRNIKITTPEDIKVAESLSSQAWEEI